MKYQRKKNSGKGFVFSYVLRCFYAAFLRHSPFMVQDVYKRQDADASIQEVCKLLGESGVKKVPVVSDNRVVGILLRSAIINYLEKQYLEQAKATHQAK